MGATVPTIASGVRRHLRRAVKLFPETGRLHDGPLAGSAPDAHRRRAREPTCEV